MALRVVEVAGLTDVGRQREAYEDNLVVAAPVFAVADGMGGARAGEVASQIAAETFGELRGKEAFAFLRAVNSGHPGSITTVHADSPAGAIDQIALLAMTSGLDLGWSKIQTYVRRVVDVIVQLDRSGGKRRVAEVQFLAGEG